MAVGDVQLNSCRNTLCLHFGVPPEPHVGSGRRAPPSRYRLVGDEANKRLRCSACGQHTALKSNAAAVEELGRRTAYLVPPMPACGSPECKDLPSALQRFGQTRSGSPRFRRCSPDASAQVIKRICDARLRIKAPFHGSIKSVQGAEHRRRREHFRRTAQEEHIDYSGGRIPKQRGHVHVHPDSICAESTGYINDAVGTSMA